MKVVPLWQPYASLVAHGRKRIETRKWPAQRYGLVGQRVAIQATKGVGSKKEGGGEPKFREICASWPFSEVLPEIGYPTPASLPRAVVLCTAVIVKCAEMTDDAIERLYETDRREYEFGLYEAGRWAWVLRELEVLPEPVPFSGHQGIPEIDDELLGYARTPAGPTRTQTALFDARAAA